MKIAVIIVTCNRIQLLSRALDSVENQTRKPNEVFVISNSDELYWEDEVVLCEKYNFQWFKNRRTSNYSGALNTGIEEIVKQVGFEDDIYFASLDDDDEWHQAYLYMLENDNLNYDLLLANIVRLNSKEKEHLVLPMELSSKDFLIGNPGVGGSNTFVRLTLLMKAGCFDESMPATVDRDVFVRIFQLNPSYRVIPQQLVIVHADDNRKRVTTNRDLKQKSFTIFYYKYQHLMSINDKALFFNRAKNVFSIEQHEIVPAYEPSLKIQQQEILFKQKGDYEFIIGLISGDKEITVRIIQTIIEKKIPVDLLLILNNLPNEETFDDFLPLLNENGINHKIASQKEWKSNLSNGHYGEYFKKFTQINSIPLGRSILQHHLFSETILMKQPVYWIIDDDVSFTSTSLENVNNNKQTDLFELINQHINRADALIGSVSKDPPLPTLSCIRGQLVDLWYSSQAKEKCYGDYLQLNTKRDYYYDLSDVHSDHLEVPIYYAADIENDLKSIFSGKGVSRPCLQKELSGAVKVVTNRGPNTLVFNREMLQSYPVINLEINKKFTRRGDLFWALLNQVVSNKTIIEHTFSLDQNRPICDFDIEKELDKAANDIIGYAFNKGVLNTIQKIKHERKPNRPKDIFEYLNREEYFGFFMENYLMFLLKRKARFIMNYYRIMGLTQLISTQNIEFTNYNKHFSTELLFSKFIKTFEEAQNTETLKNFIENLANNLWAYNKSTTLLLQDFLAHKNVIIEYFNLKNDINILGNGSEGIVFTDEKYVYKSFFSILPAEWSFLKEKSSCFDGCEVLENIELNEYKDKKFIRYTFHAFQAVKSINSIDLIKFLRFCYDKQFVFTNIKPSNFIESLSGKLKLVDYGKSFEPFTDDKFINSVKRAFLLLTHPNMSEADFRNIAQKINHGEEPIEIKDWRFFYNEVIK